MRKVIGWAVVLGLVLAFFSSPMVSASTGAEEELMSLFLKYEQAMETGDLETFEELLNTVAEG
jgi:hypothetical protein